MVSEDRLRTLLRVAESAHAAYEQEFGRRGDDWPAWYAKFVVDRLAEEEGGAHRLNVDDEEHRLLLSAVHAYLTDFGHEEADLLRRLKELHAKVQAA